MNREIMQQVMVKLRDVTKESVIWGDRGRNIPEE